MAENEDVNLIRITHYINPHMFWFKYESSFLGNTKLFELENKIQQYYLERQHKMEFKKFEPQVDEMVAVFNFSWNRWIRAKVDHIFEFTLAPPKYIVWAIDYGVPLQTDSRWIRELPAEFANILIESVYFGGISNIVPAEKTFDFMKNCPVIEVRDKWSPLAVKMIEDLINDAAMIKFTREMKNKEGQYFGNLEITTHTNQFIKANIVLLETNQATTTNEFFKVLRKLGTNKIPRWQTNEGNTLVFKYHSNKINTERIQYDSKTYEERKPPESVKSEYDLEIEKKVSDWEQRNQQSQNREEVTIDDISFNDSASVSVGMSVSKIAEQIQVEADEKEEEEPAYKVAGTSRKKRLEKYKKFVPKPPADNNPIQSAPAAKEDKTSEIEENTSQTREIQNNIDITPPNTKANESSDSKSVSSSSNSNPAINSHVAKLLNKRRSVQAKLQANPSILEKLNKMPENVIPAGFDMRNLQPTKADKQSKNRSYQSSSSDNKGINDLSNSMAKAVISRENNYQNKEKKKPLEEVDEVW